MMDCCWMLGAPFCNWQILLKRLTPQSGKNMFFWVWTLDRSHKRMIYNPRTDIEVALFEILFTHQQIGLSVTSAEIKQGFKRAFAVQWPEKLRYQGDGKPFWKLVVSEATGCSDTDYFEEVYQHYANGDAWRLPTGAHETMLVLKDAGVKLVVVSNFDNRLRKLLRDLNVVDLFDAVIISSEIGYEKPDPKIFKAALDQIKVEAGKAVHVGDDQKADKAGANAVGIDCWVFSIGFANNRGPDQII